MSGTVLVVGASGVVGNATAERFAAAGREVVAVSRRPVDIEGVDWRRLDLLDPIACRELAADLGDVTSVVYAALQENPGLFAGWTDDELIERNARMARNLFDPLLDVAESLAHVSLLHGTKAYGVHLRELAAGIHMPLRERVPIRPHRNFYFEQENHLEALRRSGAGFGLTTFRPTVVYGAATGNNMNPMPVLAAYGVLLRDAGEPLHFPGAFPDLLREAVDASLLADVLVWAADAAGVDGEAFNVTNGDVFTWEEVWPTIAEALDMEVGGDRPVSLAEWLPQHGDRWAALVDRGDLDARRDLVEFVGPNSLVYADLVTGAAPYLASGTRPGIIVNSTIKLRQAGFDGCLDSADMFAGLIERLTTQWDATSRST